MVDILAELEKQANVENKEIQYFEKMIDGAERLIRPWKVALITAIIGWAITLIVFIAFAYLTPTTYEQGQTQDFPTQQQEQTNKGSVN